MKDILNYIFKTTGEIIEGFLTVFLGLVALIIGTPILCIRKIFKVDERYERERELDMKKIEDLNC